MVRKRNARCDKQVGPRRQRRRQISELQFVGAIGVGIEVDGDLIGKEELEAIDSWRFGSRGDSGCRESTGER